MLKLPDVSNLGSLKALCDEDAEIDFFNNIVHLQVSFASYLIWFYMFMRPFVSKHIHFFFCRNIGEQGHWHGLGMLSLPVLCQRFSLSLSQERILRFILLLRVLTMSLKIYFVDITSRAS